MYQGIYHWWMQHNRVSVDEDYRSTMLQYHSFIDAKPLCERVGHDDN